MSDGEDQLGQQLEDARAEVRLLTEQLAIAERVHLALRGRIASLERALEQRGTPLPPTPAVGSDETARAARTEDYGFGEHEDDVLPEPEDRPHRWRRHD